MSRAGVLLVMGLTVCLARADLRICGKCGHENAEQGARCSHCAAALPGVTAPEADVIRGGSRLTIPSNEVVPGDVVILERGNYVPADVRLVESFNLRIEEASLTGESVPVDKKAEVTLEGEVPIGDRLNSAFMSTMVTYGRGIGVVTETGMQTEIGKIAELLQSYEPEPTPLQVKLDKLGRTLGIAALGTGVALRRRQSR